MKQPVLVRGSMAAWPYVLLTVLGFLVLALGAWAGAEQETVLATVLAIAGLILLILSPLLRMRQKRLRMWVVDHDDGFKVIDFIDERDFRDDQVLSSAMILKGNYSNGVYKSTTRRFRIWLASSNPQPEMLEMTNTMKSGEADPLAELIDRLNGRLHEQAKQDLSSGQAVLGERWSLQGEQLTMRLGKIDAECPLPELSAVDLLEDHICLWRHGQDEAFARIPANTANALLLHRLVSEHLEKQPKKEGQPPSDGHLGRILFERKPSEATPWLLLILAFVCFGIGAVLLALAKEEGMFLGGLGLLAGGGLFVLGMFYTRKQLFRCHEHGVYQRNLFSGEKSLKYDDVASFTYSATRHYHNGAYVGTHVSLIFDPVPERQGQKINYSASVQNLDAGLDELRNQISRMIAARMASRAAKGEVVPWTKNLTFHPTGIEYRPSGFFGSKEPLFIPFSTISGWNLETGYFYLWQTGKKKATVQEGIGQPNFFPGYFMLELLDQLSKEGPREVEPVDSENA